MPLFGFKYTHPAFKILDNQDKARSLALVLPAPLVQRRQARAVLLEAVEEVPVVDDAQPLGDHGADLLSDGARQQLGREGGALAVAVENQRVEGWWAQRTSGAAHGGEDTVDAVLAVLLVLGVLVVGGVGLAGEIAGEAADEAGPHVGDVRGRGSVRVGGCASARRVGSLGGVVAVREAHDVWGRSRGRGGWVGRYR